MWFSQKIRQYSKRVVPMALLLALVGGGIVLVGCDAAEQPAETAVEEPQLWTCGMHPDVIVEEPGQCPICNMDLVPVKQQTEDAEEPQLWTCGMHPDVIVEEPGQCPICNMDLVPVKQQPEQTMGAMQSMASTEEPGEKKVLYWRAPMDPTYISDKPGKSAMGMDLIPVYEGEEVSSGAAVMIDPVTMQNIGVQSTPVRQMELYRSIRTVGHLDYNEETYARVNTKFSGWIERLLVDKTGQVIRKGQPLLEIYSPQLVSTQEEYLLAYRNMKKLETSDFADVSSGARSLLESTRRRLLYWDITEQQIQNLEEKGAVSKTMTLYAPSDGIVVSKMAELGMRVTPGMDLYRIADLSTIWVYAHVYDHEAPWIRPGQRVTMDLPYTPGKVYHGTIDYIYPYLDQQARDVKIRLVFSNPRLELKPQMYANVYIESRIGRAVTVVPDDAIIRSGKKNLVFIALGGGKFEPRDVLLGMAGEDGLVQVLAGVRPGEEVITSAQFLLDSESRLKEVIRKMLESRSGAKNEDTSSKTMPADMQHQH